MSRKSPQEKKALSYAKDRRNDYGEHDKGSRRNIRRNKRMRHRVERRREHQIMAEAAGAAEADTAEATETRLASKPSKLLISFWQKGADAPLGERLEERIRRRIRLGIVDPVSGEERIGRIRRRLRGRRSVFPHTSWWSER